MLFALQFAHILIQKKTEIFFLVYLGWKLCITAMQLEVRPRGPVVAYFPELYMHSRKVVLSTQFTCTKSHTF